MPTCSDNAVKRKKQGLVKLDGTQTSVSLEPQFWDALKEIARQKRTSATELVRQVDRDRSSSNLTSAVRIFVLSHFTAATIPPGEGEPYP